MTSVNMALEFMKTYKATTLLKEGNEGSGVGLSIIASNQSTILPSIKGGYGTLTQVYRYNSTLIRKEV